MYNRMYVVYVADLLAVFSSQCLNPTTKELIYIGSKRHCMMFLIQNTTFILMRFKGCTHRGTEALRL